MSTVALTDFGGRGDGQTLNTAAFEQAFAALAEKGGGKIVVPPGIWLAWYSKPWPLVLLLVLVCGPTAFTCRTDVLVEKKSQNLRRRGARRSRGHAGLIFGCAPGTASARARMW